MSLFLFKIGQLRERRNRFRGAECNNEGKGDLSSVKTAEVAVCSCVWKGAVSPLVPEVEYIFIEACCCFELLPMLSPCKKQWN